jgi:hypothetical protein
MKAEAVVARRWGEGSLLLSVVCNLSAPKMHQKSKLRFLSKGWAAGEFASTLADHGIQAAVLPFVGLRVRLICPLSRILYRHRLTFLGRLQSQIF